MAIRKLSALTLFTLSFTMLHAALDTWVGLDSTQNTLWTRPNNWMPNAVPNNGDSLLFPAFASTFNSVNNTGTITIDAITVDSTLVYNISGGGGNVIILGAPTPSITFNPTVVNGGAHNISATLQLAGNLSISQPLSDSCQISGPISDNSMGFSVTYTGGQTLFLTNPSNSYSGGTVISANSDLSGTTQSIPATVGVNIGMGAFLDFTQSFTGSYAGLLTGAGNLSITAPGQSITLTNTGNNFAGTLFLADQTTLIGTTSTIPSNTGCQMDGFSAVLNFNQGFAGTYSSPIIGDGTVLISGGGVVTLSNAGNTYVTGTTITTGTLSVGADANMGALTAPVNLGSALTDTPVLQANAAFATGRPIRVNATNSRIDPNGFVLTHNTTNGGTATGAGGLFIGKIGGMAGTLLIQAPYTYTGGTFVELGTLQLATASAMLPQLGVSPCGDLRLEAGTTFDMSGVGVPAQLIGNFSGSGNTLLGGNSLTVTITSPSTYNGAISGAGGQFTKNGSQKLTMGTGSSYTGGTTVNNGTLMITGDDAIPGGSLAVNSPGIVDLNNFNQSLAVLLGNGSIVLGPSTVLEISSNTTNSSFSGPITGPGQVVKGGTVTLTLSGKNTFTNGLLIDQGTVILGTDNAISTLCPVDLQPGTTFDISPTAFQSVEAVNENGDVLLGSAQLTVNPIVNSFYGYVAGVPGIMSGTGSLVLAGPANYTLQSNNTFSGGTTVNRGTLILSPFNNVNALLPTGNVTVNSPGGLEISNGVSQTIGALAGNGNVLVGTGSLLTVQPVTPTTYSGSMSGQGALTVGGSSILTLAGPNIFTGGTTLTGTVTLQLATAAAKLPGPGVSPSGDLFLGAGTTFDMSSAGVPAQSVGNFSGSGNCLLGAHTLSVTITNPETYNGIFSGSGGKIIKNGAATWTLAGISSFAGELRTEQGTIEAGAADIMPNLTLLHISSGATFNLNSLDQKMGDIEGGGTLSLTDNKFSNHSRSDRTFSGVIQGSNLSKFVHHGNHTLTLKGISTMTGDFEVANGTVKVDAGAAVPAAFTVDAGAKLRGKGTVASVNNLGTVQPGASIGTLFINPGPYNESGTLQIEVNDLGQASSVDVAGDINISGGTTLKLVPELGSYTTPLTYTVATFTGTRTGTYSNVVTSLSNRFTVTEIYNANDIQVALGVNPFPIIINGGNAGAAAHCIESIPHGHGTDGLVVINALETLSDDLSALRKAFNQLQPSQYAALALAQENNDILIRSALTQRSFYRCAKEKTVQEQPAVAATDTNGTQQETAPPTEKIKEETPVGKGTIWIEPLGKYANQNRQQQNAGYRASTGGALVGADYQLLDSTSLGGALGYTFTDLEWKSSAGKADINSYYATLYGTWSYDRYFVDATFIGAYNHYHAQRNIHFPGIHRHANNEHSGYQLAESLGTGVFFNQGDWQIQPFARADYIFLHQSGFKEHGAKSLDLTIEETNSRYIRTDLGVKADWCYKTAKLKYIPYLKASWVWEKQLDGAHFESRFRDTSCTFKVAGLRPVRGLFAPSIGITILAHEETFSFEFHYDAEVGKNFWENRGYINFSHRY